ncbi:uncharacterized protein SCHCODRAFT_02341391 [Schizophyllum commune H4-8]|uniref:uncharacterized protein n=1 Tax=Schizophyllum commune (strain H4-8 / FGSC 9210) TaxID=578458 RepID=UPI002160307A|nr:uncharacterized protein SCHCODRAFT_02341391 [Schizophyllum commune H4-8]KAI5890290.1 hypothetical protein SCHCODRAFT_02341391 [Schizophyllum commune H4-8]
MFFCKAEYSPALHRPGSTTPASTLWRLSRGLHTPRVLPHRHTPSRGRCLRIKVMDCSLGASCSQVSMRLPQLVASQFSSVACCIHAGCRVAYVEVFPFFPIGSTSSPAKFSSLLPLYFGNSDVSVRYT